MQPEFGSSADPASEPTSCDGQVSTLSGHSPASRSTARRLLGELDTPPALAGAVRLDEWLRAEARAGNTDRIATRRIFQYGPKSARDNQAFKSIIALLTERGRARLEYEGRRRYVVINPALLDESA